MERNYKNIKILIIVFCLLNMPVFAKHMHYEKEYQEYWCNIHNGIIEYPVEGGRVDCLLPDYAVEFDFSKKVYESIGQSFFYAAMTNRNPAVVLIMENPVQEQIYLQKLENVSKKFNLKYWIIKPEDISNEN